MGGGEKEMGGVRGGRGRDGRGERKGSKEGGKERGFVTQLTSYTKHKHPSSEVNWL